VVGEARQCTECSSPVQGDRRAIYCSNACRQRAYRAKKGQLPNATAVYYVRSRITVSQNETVPSAPRSMSRPASILKNELQEVALTRSPSMIRRLGHRCQPVGSGRPPLRLGAKTVKMSLQRPTEALVAR
jgi:hypothetical protein